MNKEAEKLLLQIIIIIACLVPITAGVYGVLVGVNLFGNADINLNSHFRYLSGLLFGIGICFLISIPKIELHTARVRLLTFIVFIGGLARLLSLVQEGVPNDYMMFGLVMELVVTPLLCLWQNRLAKKF